MTGTLGLITLSPRVFSRYLTRCGYPARQSQIDSDVACAHLVLGACWYHRIPSSHEVYSFMSVPLVVMPCAVNQ